MGEKTRTPTPCPCLILAGLLAASSVPAATVKDARSKMGSDFEITAVHKQEATARSAIEAAWNEIDRIEATISSWREDSETSEVNRQAGIRPVPVSQELFNLIRRSIKVSELTNGAFDITFAAAGRLWDFRTRKPKIPSEETIAQALRSVGYTKVHLDDERQTVFLEDRGTRIGFGAIGKGYAANRTVHVLREQGIRSGLVSAGGDLVAFGRREVIVVGPQGFEQPPPHPRPFRRVP